MASAAQAHGLAGDQLLTHLPSIILLRTDLRRLQTLWSLTHTRESQRQGCWRSSDVMRACLEACQKSSVGGTQEAKSLWRSFGRSSQLHVPGTWYAWHAGMLACLACLSGCLSFSSSWQYAACTAQQLCILSCCAARWFSSCNLCAGHTPCLKRQLNAMRSFLVAN